MPKKIMLIDGNSIINRAFYALPILTNKDGEYTNAVYGFLNIMFKLYDEEQPDYIAIAFDLPKPTFRHIKFEQYKGTRKSMPDELRPQIPLLKSLLAKMNIKIVELEGYEADDILGSIANIADKSALNTVIISGDRDLLQLCSETIKVRIPKTKSGKTEVENYNSQDVIDKIGVTPKEYIDVKALMGDTSDNIPGVPGIGEKTAIKIIQQFKTIENAIDNAENIKPKKASENLIEYKSQAILSKELATIITDVPLEINLEEMESPKIYNENSLNEIKRLDFKTFFTRFENFTENTMQIDSKINDYNLIDNIKDLHLFADELLKENIVAFCFSFINGVNLGLSITIKETKSIFIKINDILTEEIIISELSPFFQSNVKKITLDYKKEAVFLSKFGVTLKNVVFDCMLAAYIINSSKSSYNYNDIAEEFLNENYNSDESIFGKGKNKITDKNKSILEQIEKDILLSYVCSQSNVIFRSYDVMEKILKENNQLELYYNVEFPLADVLKDMELNGIKVNKDELIEYGKTLDIKLEELTGDIYELAGEQFNINSPMQLGTILFEKLGLKSTKKTKSGYSTAADILEKLKDKHQIIEKILSYRTIAKLKSTYVDGLLNEIDENTNKIYSTFNQTITSTGRISSTEPNLQNIPIRLEIGRKLRKVFVPSSDEFIFLDGDYSQIELRVLAHMSGDETLINAFKEGQDIHRLTASQVLKIPYEQITSEQRSNAKAVNFGIVYGISAFSLSQDLNITKKEADNYIKGYFEKYPNVKKYMDLTIENAKRDGYAATIFNRRRSIPELSSSNFVQRGFGERVAMNMPIQGTAADIIKIAMIKVHKRLKEENLESRLILQVHDELLLEAKRNEIDLVKEIVKKEMENCVELLVPLETDFHLGETWYDAK